MYKLIIVVIFFGLAFSSCKKEHCEPTALSINIFGNWQIGEETVRFESAASLVDEKDELIDSEINGTALNIKSYHLIGTDSLRVKAENNSQFIELTYLITKFDCETIGLEINGVSKILDRER